METTKQIAQFIYHTGLERIPANCRHIAEHEILDGIGAAVAGSASAEEMANYLSDWVLSGVHVLKIVKLPLCDSM